MPTNANQFGTEVRHFASRLLPEQQELFIKKLGFEMLTRLILKTPVDTGHARTNWIVSLGDPSEAEVGGEDQSGQATIARGATEIGKVGPFELLWITNNVPYIERLEDGWSSQAPNGMLAETFAELEAMFGA